MATARRRSTAPVIDRVLEQPMAFEFFQAVRLLEAQGFAGASEEERSRGLGVGHDEPLSREFVRFRVQPTLAFPIAPIRRVRPSVESKAGSPAEMVVSFMGLIGPSGVLPQAYTELVLKRIQKRDESLRGFLDVFHHRAVAFFWRAWLKYRVPFAWEREQRRSGREDAFTRCVWSLVGLGSAHVRSRSALDDSAAAYYSGHMAHQPRNAQGLADMLADLFHFPVSLEQFVGRWLELAPADLSRMPDRKHPLGSNNRLGGGMILGSRVWDVQSMIRIRAGPMTYADFESLVPGSAGRERLRSIVDTYVGIGFDCELHAILEPNAAPRLRLGGTAARSEPLSPDSRLGLNTFLQSRSDDDCSRSATFSLSSAAS